MDTARRRARTREPNSWCQSSVSMLAATTSGRAKELVKQGLSERNGMIAFGRIRERFGKTAVVAKLSDVFQFQWTSSDSLEDKWLRWQKLMRQVNMTSWETMLMRRSRLLVWKSQGTSSGTTLASTRSTDLDCAVWISTCERLWTRAVSPRQWKVVP